MKYCVSIIVPIYNVEKYIEECVVSLCEQNFDSIEYIFVNDCSPDNSMSILEDVLGRYPHKAPQVRIINHEKNKGLNKSRQTGIAVATGDYILHVDSDDWINTTMVSSLYKQAKNNDSDIVICDVIYELGSGAQHTTQCFSVEKKVLLSDILCQRITPSVWNKLIKRDIYINHNLFSDTPISYSEDKYLVVRALVASDSTSYIPKALYHYRKSNETSLSKKTDPRYVEDLKVYANETKEFLKSHGLWNDFKFFMLMDIVTETIYYSLRNSDSARNNIDYIMPESKRLVYLLKNTRLSLLHKFFYVLALYNMNNTVTFLNKVRGWLSNTPQK